MKYPHYLLLLCVLLCVINNFGFHTFRQSKFASCLKPRIGHKRFSESVVTDDNIEVEQTDVKVSPVVSKEAKAAALGISVDDLVPFNRAIKYEVSVAKEAKAPAKWTKKDSDDIKMRVSVLWKEDSSYREKFLLTPREVAERQEKKDKLDAQFRRVQAKQLYFDRKVEAARVNALNYRTKRYLSIVQKMHLTRVKVARGLPKDTRIMDLLGPELWYEEKLRLKPSLVSEDLLTDQQMEKELRRRWVNETYTQEDIDTIERGDPMWVDLDDERIRAHRRESRERMANGYYWRRGVLEDVQREKEMWAEKNITAPSEAERYLKEGDDGYFYKYSRYGHYNRVMGWIFNPKPVLPKLRKDHYDIHVYDDKCNHIVYEPHEYLLFKKRTQPYNKFIHGGRTEIVDDLYHFTRPYREAKYGQL